MQNIATEMISNTLALLLSAFSGFFIPLVGGIATLMHDMPSAALTVAGSISTAANFSLANGCCICIPIPLAFGVFALSQHAKASAIAGALSQPDADQ